MLSTRNRRIIYYPVLSGGESVTEIETGSGEIFDFNNTNVAFSGVVSTITKNHIVQSGVAGILQNKLIPFYPL